VRWGLLAAQSRRPQAGQSRVWVANSRVRSGWGRAIRRGMGSL
jgi:hypothetical protein